ncbi:hypothetical protein [Thermogymnomonas acidicola]|uniref:hypothetical protein n=1 Tax=Thermogymnomonas acidicola TaxID=399579 RepID=UPI0009462953|nr:hypothetical protein [Thermogymnomonas acidicola]
MLLILLTSLWLSSTSIPLAAAVGAVACCSWQHARAGLCSWTCSLQPSQLGGAPGSEGGIVFDGPSLRFRGIRLNASKPEKGRVPGRHAIYMTATQDVSGDFYSSAVVASPSVRLESAVEGGVGSPFLALSCMVSGGWDWAGRTYFLWKGRYRSVLSVEEFPEVRANFFREFLDYGDLDAMLVCTVSEVQRPDRVLARALAALRARRDLAPETVRRASRVDEMVRYAEYLLSASAEGERIYSCTASIVVSAPDLSGSGRTSRHWRGVLSPWAEG